MSNPNRGEVWLVDLGYIAKVRPCLVVSIPALMQDRALTTLIPHTTNPRGSRFEIEVKTRFLKPGVFDAQNLITIPYVKLLKKLGELEPEQLSQIEKVLPKCRQNAPTITEADIPSPKASTADGLVVR